MRVFKLGTKWGADAPDYMELLKKGIAPAKREASVGDILAIAPGGGFHLTAIAEIQEVLDERSNPEAFAAAKEYWIAPPALEKLVRIRWLGQLNPPIEYKMQGGICEIANPEVKHKILAEVKKTA